MKQIRIRTELGIVVGIDTNFECEYQVIDKDDEATDLYFVGRINTPDNIFGKDENIFINPDLDNEETIKQCDKIF